MSRSIISNVLLLLALLLPSVSWGAPVQTGSVGSFAEGSNVSSTSVTVPADAEIAIVGVEGYEGSTANYFSGGTITLGGAAMTAISGGDASTSAFQGAMFYKVLPATGAQTLAWDLTGTSGPTDGNTWVWAYYKGIDTASAIRSSNCSQQASNPHVSGTLTATSGDLIVAFNWQFANAESTVTWTGATEVQALAVTSRADGSWAQASPTGNQTVSASGSNNQDGGVCAVVLKAAGGGGGSNPASRLPLLGVGP